MEKFHISAKCFINYCLLTGKVSAGREKDSLKCLELLP